MVQIYTLKLTHGKYYVGKTNQPISRILQHFTKSGSGWTKRFHPVEIMEVMSHCNDFDEDRVTLQYMDKYGIDNVRGGSFVKMKLSESEKKVIQTMIASQNDRCHNCGKAGHFASKCWKKQTTKKSPPTMWECDFCDRTFSSKKGTLYHMNVYCSQNPARHQSNNSDNSDMTESDEESDGNICFRCGRNGHYASKCYAKRHVHGYHL